MDKCVALYLRLSREDEESAESNSITTQRQILLDCIAADPTLSGLPIRIFTDDGVSGTHFNRPGLQMLLEEAAGGEVACIMVKDLSRLGRHTLAVGRLMEVELPYLGVRLVAPGDRYDSNDYKGTTPDIDVPIRNLLNALYSRDISAKTKSAKRTQMEKGIFSNAFAPYGYKKDPRDRHRLLIDPPAAAVVQRIFALAHGDRKPKAIADILNADGLPTPAQYKKQGGSKLAVSADARPLWTSETVSRILGDERYTGTLVGGRVETTAVGSGQKRRIPRENHVRVPDAIPSLVSYELWHSLLAKRRKSAPPKPPDTQRRLYQKVRCGYCGRLCKYIGGRVPHYRCETARYTDRYGCRRTLYPHEPIAAAVEAVLTRLFAPAWDKETGAQTLSGNKAVSAREQAAKRQLYERYKSGKLDEAAYKAAREVLARAAPSPAPSMPPQAERMVNRAVEAVFVFDPRRIDLRLAFAKPSDFPEPGEIPVAKNKNIR